MDETNLKLNINTTDNKNSPDKMKKKIVQIKDDSKPQKEKYKNVPMPIPKKTSYYDKYGNKPKETFYSTSKNPKINEILKRLKENGQIKLTDDINSNVGKIDSDKIGKYNKLMGEEKYQGVGKKTVAPKIKAFIEKINSEHNSALISNKKLPNKTASAIKKDYVNTERNKEPGNESNNKKKEKKRKKKKRRFKREYSSEEEESESDKESEEESEEKSEEESEEEIESPREERRRNRRKKKRMKNKKNKNDKIKFENLAIFNNQTLVEGQNYSGFSIVKNPAQEKYKNKKSSIDYQQFSFNYYQISDKEFMSKTTKKLRKVELETEKQIEFTLLNEIEKERIRNIIKKKGNSNIMMKTKKNFKIINKPNVTNKKRSIEYSQEDENGYHNDENSNVRKYEILGYNKKAKRMSIIDILKKRKISIISEQPFKTSTFLDKIKNAKNKENKKIFNNPKLEEIEENQEIIKDSNGTKYMIFSCSTIIRKSMINPKDLVISNEVNITLKGFIQLMNEEREKEKEKEREKEKELEKAKANMKKADKNVIGEYKKRKVNSNFIAKNKYLHKNMSNKAKDKSNVKENLNKSSALIKKNNQKDNKKSFNLDKSVQINKNAIKDKMLSGCMIYKDVNNKSIKANNIPNVPNKKQKNKKYGDENDNRAIKPPILTKYSSSNEEEEEEEEKEKEKDEEKENENIQINHVEFKTKKPNKFDELLHAYGTNHDYEIKKVKFSKDPNTNAQKSKDDMKLNSRNNVMKNAVNSNNIYTDKETNRIRSEFKRKLTHNQYRNEEENEDNDMKIFHKVKTNKAKIKKFKTNNEYDESDKMALSKKDTGNARLHGNKAKIRNFPNHSRNNISDYEYNNIVLQNSTYNHTTYNYYTNDIKKSGKKLISTHTISNVKKKKNNSSEKGNKSVGNRIKMNKSKNKGFLRY